MSGRLIITVIMLISAAFHPAAAEPDTHSSAIDSANALFDEIVNNHTNETSSKGLYECAEAYLKLCDIYYRCGYYTNAFSAATNALKIIETNNFNQLLPSVYNYLGTIYCTWRDFTLGTEYFKKGLDCYSSGCNPAIYRSLIINIQGAYLNNRSASLAKPYYEKMSELPRPDSIADYFMMLNKGLFLADENKPSEAIRYFRNAEAMAIRYTLGPSMLSSTYDYMGDCMNDLGNDSSTFYWDKAVNTEGVPSYLRLSILKKLTDAFKRLRQRDKAVYYGNLYMNLSDSIFEISDINRMKDLQMAYENDKKILKINQLDADRKASMLQLSNQRRFLIAAICVIAIFIVLAVILLWQKKRLQQAYIDLFSRNKEAMQLQEDANLRESELRERITQLENEIKSPDKNMPVKTQSVDKLSDEKRDEISSAIDTILKQDDVICNPDFSVDTLAELTGYNSRYVSHILNETYSCNFRTLLNKRRMDIARERIMNVGTYGNLTIQAIAESVGYKSTSGFVQLFRKHTGVTPSMFQKMAKGQNIPGTHDDNLR